MCVSTYCGSSSIAAIGLRGAGLAEDLDETAQNAQNTGAADLFLLVVGAGGAVGAGHDLRRGSNGDSGQSEESGDSTELHFEFRKSVGPEKRVKRSLRRAEDGCEDLKTED